MPKPERKLGNHLPLVQRLTVPPDTGLRPVDLDEWRPVPSGPVTVPANIASVIEDPMAVSTETAVTRRHRSIDSIPERYFKKREDTPHLCRHSHIPDIQVGRANAIAIELCKVVREARRTEVTLIEPPIVHAADFPVA